ncbi:MAG: hypothetical protein C0483_06340 [Pirellula sp.]|nr:hypothetical protein [Pirellula sp.]
MTVISLIYPSAVRRMAGLPFFSSYETSRTSGAAILRLRACAFYLGRKSVLIEESVARAIRQSALRIGR